MPVWAFDEPKKKKRVKKDKRGKVASATDPTNPTDETADDSSAPSAPVSTGTSTALPVRIAPTARGATVEEIEDEDI